MATLPLQPYASDRQVLNPSSGFTGTRGGRVHPGQGEDVRGAAARRGHGGRSHRGGRLVVGRVAHVPLQQDGAGGAEAGEERAGGEVRCQRGAGECAPVCLARGSALRRRWCRFTRRRSFAGHPHIRRRRHSMGIPVGGRRQFGHPCDERLPHVPRRHKVRIDALRGSYDALAYGRVPNGRLIDLPPRRQVAICELIDEIEKAFVFCDPTGARRRVRRKCVAHFTVPALEQGHVAVL